MIKQKHNQHGKNAGWIHYDSSVVQSRISSARYTGPRFVERTSYVWAVRWFDTANRSSGWSRDAEFHFAIRSTDFSAKWIGDPHAPNQAGTNLFRSSFSLKAVDGVSRATLYVCGLGYSHASVNGKPASQNYLTTAPWTNNERRNGYSTFDITSLLNKAGVNVIGVALGAGWRDLTKFPRHDPADAKGDSTWRTVTAEVHLLMTSGEERVVSATGDGSWTMSSGPVVFDSVYDGETYDARLEQPGWDTAAGLNQAAAHEWKKAVVLSDGPRGRLTPWSAPPVLLDRVVSPVSITNPRPGMFVVDFGINVAGVAKLSGIVLPAGHNVTLKYAEILQHDHLPDVPKPDPKMIYQGNLRTAKATDVYISRGASSAVFLPQFT